MSSRLKRRSFLSGGLAIAGCGSSLHHFPFDTSRTISHHLGLEIIFYSVCCVQIRSAAGSILCDPFFTHLPFRQVAFGECLPEHAEIDRFLPEFSDIRATIVGHNHYDHNMALPYIDPYLATDAVHLGSKTMVHTFAPNALSHPLINLNDQVATPHSEGKWWVHPSGDFRVLPILSGHPTQYLFIHLFTEVLTEDRKTPPRKASHYQEGITLAFLVDFLDGSKVSKRLYIQSSSTGYPAGFFPESILEEKTVDVAILAMDSANIHMKTGKSILSHIAPPIVFWTHFENFFRAKDKIPREIIKVNLPKTKSYFADFSNQLSVFSAYHQRYRL